MNASARTFLALSLVVCGGCFQAHYSYDGPKLLTTGPDLGSEVEMVEHFRVHERQFYLFYGNKKIGKIRNGAEMAATAAGDHDGVINLQLSDGQNIVDMLFSNFVCLLSVVCGSWSIWAEGDVVDVVGPLESVWVAPPPSPEEPVRIADEETAPDDAPAASLAVLPAAQETP
jgi:hypothetical protein